MPTIVKVTCDQPDEILNTGAYGAGAIIRLQTAATEAGAFADVTGTGSTPTLAIVAGTRVYTGYDPNGLVSSWYRSRYENVGATRLSDWTTAFQVGDEGGGLCSLYDVKQRTGRTASTDTKDDEQIIEFIVQVSSDIMGYTERRFARTPSSGTTTFLFDVECASRELRIPQGIASATTLEVATQSQPESAGTYSTVTAAEWFLRPVTAERTYGWPATRIVISDLSSSSFYPGYNTVRVTMALGWAQVPGDIRGIAENAVIRRLAAKGSGVATALGSDDFAGRLLRWVSPEERERLDWYRVIPV